MSSLSFTSYFSNRSRQRKQSSLQSLESRIKPTTIYSYLISDIKATVYMYMLYLPSDHFVQQQNERSAQTSVLRPRPSFSPYAYCCNLCQAKSRFLDNRGFLLTMGRTVAVKRRLQTADCRLSEFRGQLSNNDY